MSFSSAVIVSSIVDKSLKLSMEQQALARWPFLRRPVLESHPEHLVLALPETTDHLYAQKATLDHAFAQNNLVYGALPQWSSAFSAVYFALIEAECFEGKCQYGGYVCKNGQVCLEVIADKRGHVRLLEDIGLVIENFFAPLVRGYFEPSVQEIPLGKAG